MAYEKVGRIVAVVQDWNTPDCCVYKVTFEDGQVVELVMNERSYRIWNVLVEACDGGRNYAY